MVTDKMVEALLGSRRGLVRVGQPQRSTAAEGGCGVVGLASSFPVEGRHLVPAALQMHNRGNGKGGGIAAAGLTAEQMGVSPELLRDATLLQIAYLDPESRGEVEGSILNGAYEVLEGYRVPTLDDYREVPGLEVRPPDVWRYFVRARGDALDRFASEHGLGALEPRRLEDEFVYQTTFRLNTRFYASLGEQQAFVLSHGRDLLVFKIVGYAEQAAAYYRLEDLEAHVWIAHQRYPTKGRVWHPGGAHPFIGLNEALVHNGDFANYHATCTYLRQRNIVPLFLTDTEVSVLLFDLWDRVYRYPLEVIIEALAPTTERDFEMLPPEKQELYRAVQATHIHASPDGPWFFIIARSHPDDGEWQLLGITDTSMLRPQVFALMENEVDGERVQVGLIASEKQAIDATLRSLHADDARVCPVADRYWNARGGSYTDGGAFAFTVKRDGANGARTLTCTNKFGEVVATPTGQAHNVGVRLSEGRSLGAIPLPDDPEGAWVEIARALPAWGYEELAGYCRGLVQEAPTDVALATLTRLRDRAYDPGKKRRASMVALIDDAIEALLKELPTLDGASRAWSRLDWTTREALRPPRAGEEALVVDVSAFPPEGDEGPGPFLARAASQGWRRLVTHGWKGQRFAGCGLGANSTGVRIDVYGSSGDYLGSGLDGGEIHVHGSAQDQVGQILNAGRLVIHGDAGQTFMYGAKGGEAYVRGDAAGRPLINAVGSPRVVINGTCLDYLAESFMAGDPLNGGGFVVLNAVTFDDEGRLVELEEPYPGGNLYSLASGGAIYIRDPHGRVGEEQLNGGALTHLTEKDWALIEPYLRENERLFGIRVDELLTVEGEGRAPHEVWRKVAAQHLTVLT
jgi:glutamate synthase domain-containing protein 1/glutamate synthase domain-containing protein 3